MICKRCNNNPEKGDLFCRRCGEELPADDTFQCECGAEVSNEDRYCHKCGAMFSAGSCKSCSADLPPNAKYCSECGAKQDESEERGSYEFPASENSEAPSYEPETPSYEPSQESSPKIEVYDEYGNARPFDEKQEPPKRPKYKMTGDGYFEP